MLILSRFDYESFGSISIVVYKYTDKKKDRPKWSGLSLKNQTNYFMKTVFNYFTAISLD
jgi:hypothetical protein